jgi:hypothetical protein
MGPIQDLMREKLLPTGQGDLDGARMLVDAAEKPEERHRAARASTPSKQRVAGGGRAAPARPEAAGSGPPATSPTASSNRSYSI